MIAPQRRLSRLAAAAAVALASLAAPAAAETSLGARPHETVPREALDRFTALADEIGWGSLFRTEQMAVADTAYGTGPVLAVTATPYLPIHFWLESRAWAAQRFRPLTDADERFMTFFVDAGDGLVFDLLAIGEGEASLGADGLSVTYVDSTGTRLPALIEDHEAADERAMGGSLRTARARLRVPFPEPPDWTAIETIGLEVTAAGDTFAVGWRFPPAE